MCCWMLTDSLGCCLFHSCCPLVQGSYQLVTFKIPFQNKIWPGVPLGWCRGDQQKRSPVMFHWLLSLYGHQLVDCTHWSCLGLEISVLFLFLFQPESLAPTAETTPCSCCGKMRLSLKFSELQAPPKNDILVKSYARFPEVCLHRGMDWNNFLYFAFTVFVITLLPEGLFGPFKMLTLSPNSALQVPTIGFVEGWAVGTPETADSLIPANLLL